jgi:ADP-ribose pyrophosphatase
MNAATPTLPPIDPAVDSRELVYRNPYQEIHRVCLRFGDHAKTIFVNEHGQRVGVLLVREGAVLLVRQYRLLVTGLAWEIPGGRVDDGETPEIAARRETIEEAGVRCGHLHSLLYFLPGLDTCNNPTHLFYCDDFEESRSTGPDSLEVVDRNWKPLEACLQMIFSGEIVDGLTIIALLAHHTRLRKP